MYAHYTISGLIYIKSGIFLTLRLNKSCSTSSQVALLQCKREFQFITLVNFRFELFKNEQLKWFCMWPCELPFWLRYGVCIVWPVLYLFSKKSFISWWTVWAYVSIQKLCVITLPQYDTCQCVDANADGSPYSIDNNYFKFIEPRFGLMSCLYMTVR